MTHRSSYLRIGLGAAAVLALCALAYFGMSHPSDAIGPLMLATGGAVDFDAVMKGLNVVEQKLKEFDTKSEAERKANGEVSKDTKTAIDNLGKDQRELADRLLQLEQKGLLPGGAGGESKEETWGSQFVKGCTGEQRGAMLNGDRKSVGFEVKNTVTNPVGNTFTDRQPGIVSGAFRRLTLESLLSKIPTSSNAVDYVKENVFTNNAAETAEAGNLPESAVTTLPVTEPVATVGHFLKISRQLAADNPALAAYINLRLKYGVDLRVENQIWGGSGVAPNMSGFTKNGNYTPHGYTAAILAAAGLANNGFDLIGKMIGDSESSDFPADAIVLNPTDWWTLRLTKDGQGRYILGDPGQNIDAVLFDKPVLRTNACAAGNVGVLSMGQSSTFYEREGVQIDMSEHDGDNFQKMLITLRAFRRCMLAVERAAAVRYGSLKPA